MISLSINQYRHSMKVTLSGYRHLYKKIVSLCRMMSSIIGSCLGGHWFRKKKNIAGISCTDLSVFQVTGKDCKAFLSLYGLIPTCYYCTFSSLLASRFIDK